MPISRRLLLQSLIAQPLLAGVAWAQARLVGKPKPLPAGAVTHDWTSFLGPTHNAVSTETKLTRTLPPPLIWEFSKGTSYSSPAISGDRLMYIYRVGDQEIVECLDALTGVSRWQFKYGTVFEDRYGYNNGPRSSPVIDGGRGIHDGAEGKLHCLELASGKVIWKKDLRADYKVPQDFFGTASTPLVEGRLLIVNVGAPGWSVRRRNGYGDGERRVARRQCVGTELCVTGARGCPRSASRVRVRGRRVRSADRRAHVDRSGDGKVDFSFPWRSRSYESVNASCPVVFDNKVFISASYRTGGALLQINPDFSHKVCGRRRSLGCTSTRRSIATDICTGSMAAMNPMPRWRVSTSRRGKVAWRETPEWNETVGGRQVTVGTYRGSLLAVDGSYLCLGELGHLMWMDLTPKGYKEISRAWLFQARESWTLPVLSRGLLYVVQNTRELTRANGPRLLCYDLRASS
jgi:outer membrane protein assembly factor BamB